MEFYKYHGTGNDFIIIDNRNGEVVLTADDVADLCNRRFGIGADGLMLLEQAEGYDFRMVYYNSDGNESTMCGNGGRCIVAFAREKGLISTKANFLAIDGAHAATIEDDGLVSLHMQDVTEIKLHEDHAVLNTGSPHYVRWVDDVVHTDVYGEGHSIRNLPVYQPKGINVNFVQALDGNRLLVRTYERGVEDETLSCGTGVTASAIAATGDTTGIFLTDIETPGGVLTVSFTKHDPLSATGIVLTGPAVLVFTGNI